MLTHCYSRKEALLLFSVAVFIYLLPLILADYFYVEDNYRAISGHATWNPEGRFLITWFYSFLSLSDGAPNSFPLALLIGGATMAFALERLAAHYFPSVDIVSAVVVLPMFFNPLFLSNLVYQYDGPLMTLGMAAVMFSITFKSGRKWIEWGVSCLLIGVAVSIYQPLINVLVGLCCIELYRGVQNNKTLFELTVFSAEKLAQVMIVFCVYLVAVVPFMADARQDLVPFNADWALTMVQRLQHAEERIRPLYNAGSAWFFIGMLILFSVGYVWTGLSALGNRSTWPGKISISLIYLLIVPMLLVFVPGIMLVFFYENSDARVMVGAGPLLVFLLLVIHQLLKRLHRYSRLLMVLPLVFMVGLAFSYGRVLSLKKELESSLMQSLAYSISAHPQLALVKTFYFHSLNQRYWLPASAGTDSILPIMPYLVNASFLVLPEAMVRVGITNILPSNPQHSARALLERTIQPVVDNLFYSIYLDNGDGYIVMKNMQRYSPTGTL